MRQAPSRGQLLPTLQPLRMAHLLAVRGLRPPNVPGVLQRGDRPTRHQKCPLPHVRPLPIRVQLPGPPRLMRWPVDGSLATDRGGRPSIAAAAGQYRPPVGWIRELGRHAPVQRLDKLGP
jgi:hypothetical protein